MSLLSVLGTAFLALLMLKLGGIGGGGRLVVVVGDGSALVRVGLVGWRPW